MSHSNGECTVECCQCRLREALVLIELLIEERDAWAKMARQYAAERIRELFRDSM